METERPIIIKGKRYHLDLKKIVKGLKYSSSWEDVGTGEDLGEKEDKELP